MSDTPSNSDATPPPPPPPPDLVAPSGYAAYNTGAMGSLNLSRVTGLGRAASILVGLTMVSAVGGFLIGRSLVDEANRFLDGETNSTQFGQSIGAYSLTSLLSLVFQIAAIVVVIIWLYRIARNDAAVGRGGRWGPGWAIGGWFAPPLVPVIPALTIQQQWQASDPNATESDWKQSPTSPLVWVWAAVWGASMLLPIAGGSTEFAAGPEGIAKALVNTSSMEIITLVLQTVAAILFIILCNQLTRRHAQMTGEKAADA